MRLEPGAAAAAERRIKAGLTQPGDWDIMTAYWTHNIMHSPIPGIADVCARYRNSLKAQEWAAVQARRQRS